ncbi:hypothetical protein Ahy_B03g066084 [Arachis hypogaea]|uniref:MHD1 domain-containing protein n=1 Tax=Arachis hypogaea TaxID=3818 RepID=A0A445A337_ARAHY|nr:hypothetical protein Ahy_B03g066084 [Arachis hypogaea]
MEENLPSPFTNVVPNLSESELRETAYEILLAACRSSGPNAGDRNAVVQRSPTWKKTVGLKTVSSRSTRSGARGELMRVQMRVSELTDTIIRRALLRVGAAGQLGRRMVSMVMPLELIQHVRRSDFPSQQEYEAWLRRNLKVLEAGILLHPHLPLVETHTDDMVHLKRMISASIEKPMDLGNNNELVQALRSVVMSLASRSSDCSVPETFHWADGFPINLKIYQTLIEACFDNKEETCVIEEVDEVIELIKKTWVVLGMNQMLHNICFSWILFHKYVSTGQQVDNDLLFASSNLLAEAEKDLKSMEDPFLSNTLRSTLGLMLSWSEKRLLAYHDTFYIGNIGTMQSVVSLAVSSANILMGDTSLNKRNMISKEAEVSCTRVENYIRSSLFAKSEKLDPSKYVSEKQNKALHGLSILAQDVSELASYEKAMFSPILKRWHPLAAGVAVATLHLCYGNELKQYVRSITELTPDAVEVLLAADKLEKHLVQIAVEDSIDSEDGGISIIREMHPYGAEAIISILVKSWINTKVDRLQELINTNLQQEACHLEWKPHAKKESIALSAVEVLRMIDDTLEEFFLLPIPTHAVLLPELITGLDNSLQQYIFKAKSGCGNRNTFIPTLPPLTRCSRGSKFDVIFKRKEKTQLKQSRNSQVGTKKHESSLELPQLFVRINTLQRMSMELKVLQRRTMTRLRSFAFIEEDDAKAVFNFKLSTAASIEGVNQLSETIAYKIIFRDLCHVLWNGLYVGEVSATRIEPFLEELEQYLETVSSTVQDRAKRLVTTKVMEAAFEGFLLVLLAGGPSRSFSLEDSAMIEEDFKCLTDMFWSNGNGLPTELIEQLSTTVKDVLPLLSMDTEYLIQQLGFTMEMCGPLGKSQLQPLPSTTGQWSPTEPSTLLRVLCYRHHDTASKFLKKNYNLPTKI